MKHNIHLFCRRYHSQVVLALLIAIVVLAASFRLYGINWDIGQYLHPDERFLVMVTTALSWPKSLQEYFSTTTSPLNPHNVGFQFYVYGTWPIILTKAVGELFGKTVYGNLHLVGRPLAALFDIGTLLLIFLTTRRLAIYTAINSNNRLADLAAIVAAACYAIMLLPIQLSHFNSVDSYLTFGITGVLFSMTFVPTWKTGILTGIFFGLAIAAKISAVILIGALFVYSIYYSVLFIMNKKIVHLLLYILILSAVTFCVIRVLMPYLFSEVSLVGINPLVLNNWRELQSYNDPQAWFPPSVQWVNTPMLVYPLIQLLFWGLGIPLFIICFIAFITSCVHIGTIISLLFQTTIKRQPKLFSLQYPKLLLSMPIVIILIFFFYQGVQFALPLRYFWPILPPLSVLVGCFVIQLFYNKNHHYLWFFRLSRFMISLLFLLAFFWSFSYLSIYSQPHSRIQASNWIYNTAPETAVLSSEHWDDGLPLNLPTGTNSRYTSLEMPMYFPESPEKWLDIEAKLQQIDFLILSSNRVYGSISSAPEKYPQTTSFYQQLFAGNLNFIPVAQFVSRPRLNIPFLSLCIDIPFFRYGSIDRPITNQFNQQLHRCQGLVFVDDYAEESWTVYDHPKVTIFARTPNK